MDAATGEPDSAETGNIWVRMSRDKERSSYGCALALPAGYGEGRDDFVAHTQGCIQLGAPGHVGTEARSEGNDFANELVTTD